MTLYDEKDSYHRPPLLFRLGTGTARVQAVKELLSLWLSSMSLLYIYKKALYMLPQTEKIVGETEHSIEETVVLLD